ADDGIRDRHVTGVQTCALPISQEAEEIRKSYQESIEKKLGNEWEFMRDWVGKLTGAVVRIAALMHAAECMGNPTEIPISAETMEIGRASCRERGGNGRRRGSFA